MCRHTIIYIREESILGCGYPQGVLQSTPRILKDNSTYRIYISKENRPFRFILFMSLLVITDLSSDRIITAEIFLNMHH